MALSLFLDIVQVDIALIPTQALAPLVAAKYAREGGGGAGVEGEEDVVGEDKVKSLTQLVEAVLIYCVNTLKYPVESVILMGRGAFAPVCAAACGGAGPAGAERLAGALVLQSPILGIVREKDRGSGGGKPGAAGSLVLVRRADGSTGDTVRRKKDAASTDGMAANMKIPVLVGAHADDDESPGEGSGTTVPKLHCADADIIFDSLPKKIRHGATGGGAFKVAGATAEDMDMEDDWLERLTVFVNSLGSTKGGGGSGGGGGSSGSGITLEVERPVAPAHYTGPAQVIGTFLTDNGFGAYNDQLLAAGYFDLDFLRSADDIDLQAAGMENEADRARLLRVLAEPSPGAGRGLSDDGRARTASVSNRLWKTLRTSFRGERQPRETSRATSPTSMLSTSGGSSGGSAIGSRSAPTSSDSLVSPRTAVAHIADEADNDLAMLRQSGSVVKVRACGADAVADRLEAAGIAVSDDGTISETDVQRYKEQQIARYLAKHESSGTGGDDS